MRPILFFPSHRFSRVSFLPATGCLSFCCRGSTDSSSDHREDVKRDLRVVHPAADASHTQHSLGTSHPLFPVTRNKATLARVFA